MNIDQFEKRINESFHKNGGFEDIIFSMNYDVDQMLQVNAEAYNKERDISISVERLGRGMKSIYMLSHSGNRNGSLFSVCRQTDCQGYRS